MDLFYPIILISSLIFVHELGHFLFAKAFGVKVLTFSLGFGPKVLRLRGRETEYCVSLIPLGGYVRMLEAAKSDVVLPEDRRRTFESLPLYKRIVIVLAGPAMNLVFPVLLYFAVFVGDGPFLPPTVGIVLPGHPADGKLMAGDRIMSVNGEEVATFDEVERIVAKSPGELLHFKVFRDNRHVDVEVTSEEKVERRELDITDRVGSVGIATSAPAAVIGVPNAESPAYRAGLRTFDIVTNVGGLPVRRFRDLNEAFRDNAGETLPITYLRPISVPNALGGLADAAVFEAGVVALTPDAAGTTLLERTGLELADLYAAVVPEDSYFYKAGLRPGDKVLKFDGEPVAAWSTFRERVMAQPDRPHRIDYQAARDGVVRSGTFQVRREDFTDDHGQSFSRYVLQIQDWVPLAPEDSVEHSAPLRYAMTKAIEETADVTHFVMVSLVRLIEGRISLKALSGPITIYEVAGEEGRKGADHFIWVMALISINLGLFNLLPIPVLDGGHLLFFGIEGVLRRPLPMRIRELAHVVGMAILVGLTMLAFKNDLEKRWDANAQAAKGPRG
ncbi:MAG TPA: RIP metalloprotease RseP [Polyangiaceae bacterium]|nr:RIP metalloprotease RseP [Polyangiaceae bacterium]HYQ28299.1 RIP metalloprotease RseP [Polyangiaceae bacterium]